MVTISDDLTPDLLAGVREIFAVYFADQVDGPVRGDLGKEQARLPAPYAPPEGALLLATVDGRAAGCVAMRRLEPLICEMKRMYVLSEFRGRGLGRRLATELMGRARASGYELMRLDTRPTRLAALALYRDLGFSEIPPYWDCPVPGMRFMEIRLDQSLSPASR